MFRRVVEAALGTAGDLGRGLGRASFREALRTELTRLPVAGLGTLPWLLRATTGGTLLDAALRNARRDPDGIAFRDHETSWSWARLDRFTSEVAYALAARGVRRGDVVALLGPNAPAYVGFVLGCTRVGATCALLNTHLEGRPLAHAIESSRARLLIAHESFDGRVDALELEVPRLDYDDAAELPAAAPFPPFPAVKTDPEADYVYIFTSGTTGLPKPCRISHGRAVLAGAGFAQLMFALGPGDVVYNVLPLYHASGLMLGAGACVTAGATMAMRDGFSASRFWSDAVAFDATAVLYIGELCRYLVNAPPHPDERRHRVRVAVGNGLRPDVWAAFVERFGIPQVREFYAATEAPGFIVNLTGKVGSVGRVPVRRSGWMRLVRWDVDREEHVRGPDGKPIECAPGEVGELLVRLAARPLTAASEYRGYTDTGATQKKVLEDVFEPGDRYFRTGDLLRRDQDDYFFFVDRIGDTYRWKGENVSTAEVADVLGAAAGVREATVVGVAVPGMEGRCGLAAVVTDGAFDPDAFWRTAQELPDYAQPRFVRVLEALATTGTFKIQKAALRREGCDPAAVSDPLYVRDTGRYRPMEPDDLGAIADGRLRL